MNQADVLKLAEASGDDIWDGCIARFYESELISFASLCIEVGRKQERETMLLDEAKAREELIARYDSLQSQYAELSVALDSAAQECDCEHWQYCGICATPEQREILKKPPPAPKPQTVTSTLPDDDIRSIFRNHAYPNNPKEAADDLRGCRAIAQRQDALTRKAVIAEIMALSYKLASEPDLKDREYNAIAHFLASLPELLKEPK